MIASKAAADSADGPAGPRHGRREAEPGQRRHDDVEGVLGAAAVRDRIDERADHPDGLDERARVAVEDEQGRRTGHGRAHVDEVDGLAVDLAP